MSESEGSQSPILVSRVYVRKRNKGPSLGESPSNKHSRSPNSDSGKGKEKLRKKKKRSSKLADFLDEDPTSDDNLHDGNIVSNGREDPEWNNKKSPKKRKMSKAKESKSEITRTQANSLSDIDDLTQSKKYFEEIDKFELVDEEKQASRSNHEESECNEHENPAIQLSNQEKTSNICNSLVLLPQSASPSPTAEAALSCSTFTPHEISGIADSTTPNPNTTLKQSNNFNFSNKEKQTMQSHPHIYREYEEYIEALGDIIEPVSFEEFSQERLSQSQEFDFQIN